MKRVHLLLVAPLLGAAAPTSHHQFDLICRGSTHTLDADMLTDTTEPYSAEYRIDLDSKKFCVDACAAGAEDLDSETDTRIIFDKMVDDPISGSRGWYVDRTTGALSNYSFQANHRHSLSVTASCEVAPFRGIDKPVTKF